jgi:pimeloyl-ACP methyl ester carboxylesterase
MRTYTLFHILLFGGIACGCTELTSVQSKRAAVPHYRASSKALLAIENRLSEAERASEQEPLIALGEDLAAARIALDRLAQDQHESQARELYNFAVARSVEDLQRSAVKPWDGPVNVPSPDGPFLLRRVSSTHGERTLFSERVVPADRIKLGSRLFTSRSTVEGIGAPVVAIAPTESSARRARFEPEHLYAAETAAITFQGHRAQIELFDRLSTDRISIDGHSYPLAADFSAPLGLGMMRERPNRIGAAAFLLPDKYRTRARLVRLQPFDAKRTPVIFVHGLASGPLFWTPLINKLVADPDIRRRYQFWVFWYPTGYPFPYSAVQLREELDNAKKTFPNSKKVILVGHSLGGLVVRLLVTDAGDKIWRGVLGKSPAQMQLTGSAAETLKESLIFNHRTDVQRAIFITTPHRGTTVASHWWIRLAARAIRQPRSFTDIRAIVNSDPAAQHLNRIPTCVETLAPDDPIVLALSKLPVSPTIPFHTIEGDRGRGDAPNSNDGMVAYWSSHLDGATSEVVIPSGHAAQVHPAGIAEVRRILRSSE